jgi:hypothetical protein
MACAILAVSAGLLTDSARGNIVWETAFADEQAISSGSLYTDPGGVTTTFSTTVVSDSDGGTFDLSLYRNTDYFTVEADVLGRHTGYLELSFNNENSDPADYLELTLSFSEAVSELQFSLLDVDSGNWDDGVEVFVNGTTNARDTSAWTAHPYAGPDNESYMHGFEGLGFNAGNGQAHGNIDFDFGSLLISSLTVRYFSTDDAGTNPGGQVVGLSDVTYTQPVAEATALGCCAVFFVIVGLSTVRRVWPQPARRLASASTREMSPRALPVRGAGPAGDGSLGPVTHPGFLPATHWAHAA